MTKIARSPRKSEPPRASIEGEGMAPIAVAAAQLLVWYDRHRRVMPWRAEAGQAADPYGVWLSEIMLQQTTVAAVRAYWLAYMARWPNVEALATAPVEDVMKAWAGLGYYSRARNLHACAVVVSRDHGGVFPNTEAALRKLPGIGAYTAAAIAAIAFGEPAAVVDGNVERVISRVLAIDTPFPQAKPMVGQAVARMVPRDRPATSRRPPWIWARRSARRGGRLAPYALGGRGVAPPRPECRPVPGQSCQAGAGDAIWRGFCGSSGRRHRAGRHAAAAWTAGRHDGVSRPRRGAWERSVEGGPPLSAAWDRHAAPVLWSFTHFDLELTVHVAAVEVEVPAPAGLRWVSEATLADEGLPSVMRKVFDAAAPYVPRQRGMPPRVQTSG